jgi:hypothetical protein
MDRSRFLNLRPRRNTRVVSSAAWSATAAMLAAVVLTIAGCANSAISAARRELDAGHYAAAHRYLVVAQRENVLSNREQREVKENLCLTEFKIGAPAYPLAEQRRVCADAVALRSRSGGRLLAKIDDLQRAALVSEITQSLEAGDVAEANDAINRYQRVPGADPRLVASWSKRLWTMIDRQERTDARSHGNVVAPAISAMMREYTPVKAMDNSAFRKWVEASMMVDGTSIVSNVEIGKRTLNLWIPDDRLHAAALNLDRFARVNNALVARCHCDARTKIAVEETGLPAYLVRLDPETRQSEILILAGP